MLTAVAVPASLALTNSKTAQAATSVVSSTGGIPVNANHRATSRSLADRRRTADDRCRRRIAQATCLVSPGPSVFTNAGYRRNCRPGSARFTGELLRLYELYPPVMKREMCRLRRIFIEDKFWASGYALTSRPGIGIHRRFFDDATPLADWLTWKERRVVAVRDLDAQLRGGEVIALPTVDVLPSPRELDPLTAADYIVAHELAHRIALYRLPVRSGAFALRNWRGNPRRASPRALPKDWIAPCFYRCGREQSAGLPLSELPIAYERLSRVPFISLYATRNPQEDMAESITAGMLRARDIGMRVRLGPRIALDLETVWASPRFTGKRRAVERLFREAEADAQGDG
ncbi:MAG: hypothetical protein AAFQ42_07140 [Pseudomonadota bacterium]